MEVQIFYCMSYAWLGTLDQKVLGKLAYYHLLSAKIFSIWRSSKLKRVNELDVVHLASWVWRSIVSNLVVLTYFT
jgi:hypothetical protein